MRQETGCYKQPRLQNSLQVTQEIILAENRPSIPTIPTCTLTTATLCATSRLYCFALTSLARRSGFSSTLAPAARRRSCFLTARSSCFLTTLSSCFLTTRGSCFFTTRSCFLTARSSCFLTTRSSCLLSLPTNSLLCHSFLPSTSSCSFNGSRLTTPTDSLTPFLAALFGCTLKRISAAQRYLAQCYPRSSGLRLASSQSSIIRGQTAACSLTFSSRTSRLFICNKHISNFLDSRGMSLTRCL